MRKVLALVTITGLVIVVSSSADARGGGFGGVEAPPASVHQHFLPGKSLDRTGLMLIQRPATDIRELQVTRPVGRCV